MGICLNKSAHVNTFTVRSCPRRPLRIHPPHSSPALLHPEVPHFRPTGTHRLHGRVRRRLRQLLRRRGERTIVEPSHGREEERGRPRGVRFAVRRSRTAPDRRGHDQIHAHPGLRAQLITRVAPRAVAHIGGLCRYAGGIGIAGDAAVAVSGEWGGGGSGRQVGTDLPSPYPP